MSSADSRRSSTANSPGRGVPYNVPNAALRGASLAFAAKPPPVKPKPVVQTRYPGINGALSPANVASRTSSPEGRLERTQSLLEPGVVSRNPSRSPSMSNTRRASMTPRSRSDNSEDCPGRSRSSLRQVESANDGPAEPGAKEEGEENNGGPRDDAPTDSTSIAPTTSLVKLFEQTSQNPADIPLKRAVTPTLEPTKSKPPPILSPKPQRTISVRSVSKELDPDSPDITVTKPSLPLPRRSKVNHASTEPVSSPSPQPYLSNPYKNQSIQRISPHITGDSLANAIVGAHLAASRQPTPHRQKTSPSRPPSPRRKHSHHILSRSPSPTRREPGRLRHTLRHDPSSESADESPPRQSLKHLVKKHPHKHHEGTRKRWRDTVTERERKRYEGVWAANRGLYLPGSDALTTTTYTTSATGNGIEDDVLNLVVRDVWLRSRLPEQVLEEIWFLVDRREVGRLSKEEFVVGLWLVDQRLKGRKLPPRVGESVWASVTGLGTRGVKVRVKDSMGRKKVDRPGQ